MLQATQFLRFGGFRILLSALALVSLLLGGGVYAHAYEISPRDHVHAAASDDHHGHTSGCPMCTEDERPVHCGANILMTASVADIDHPALAPQTTDIRYSQLAGHLLIPESPPPRAFPVLEM